jgi:hypothetical protein
MQIHHSIRKLHAHIQGVQRRQLQLPNMKKMVQRAPWHVLRNQAWRHLQASSNESHQTFVAEVTEGFDLLGQILQDNFGHQGIVPIQLLDGYLFASVETPKDLTKFTRAKTFHKRKV